MILHRQREFSCWAVVVIILEQQVQRMYRVLLKVDRVCLRIKESVELSIQIRKNERQFVHCKRQALVNGELALANTSEFFIHSKSPTFSIEIYLLLGAVKKKGGVVEVNLDSFEINASHRVKAPILHIPIQNCALYLDFVYMISSKLFEGQEMYSLEELENLSHREYLETINHQNEQLIHQKQRLHGQIQQLKLKNETLQHQNNALLENYEARQIECQNEIQLMEEERDSSQGTLELEKKKIAQIVDFINESNNSQLIIEAEGIINHMPNQSKPSETKPI